MRHRIIQKFLRPCSEGDEVSESELVGKNLVWVSAGKRLKRGPQAARQAHLIVLISLVKKEGCDRLSPAPGGSMIKVHFDFEWIKIKKATKRG